MQNTTNYNFNLPEGTDLWNYLTQTNPNFTALDSILKGVSDATVTTATEVASGTAHAISRTLPDANVIRFTATSNWTLGDTMTIDGTPVTVVKPNGTNLQTGDYVIGAEVLGVIRATQFTVYCGAPSSLDAADVTYDNTGSGLAGTNVQDAIDEVNSNLSVQDISSKISSTYLTANTAVKIGNICIVSGRFQLSTASNITGMSLASFNSDIAPIYDARVSATIIKDKNSATTDIYSIPLQIRSGSNDVRVENEPAIQKIGAVSSATWIYATMIWITN